jgi:hypothetical protein
MIICTLYFEYSTPIIEMSVAVPPLESFHSLNDRFCQIQAENDPWTR